MLGSTTLDTKICDCLNPLWKVIEYMNKAPTHPVYSKASLDDQIQCNVMPCQQLLYCVVWGAVTRLKSLYMFNINEIVSCLIYLLR